MAPVKTKPWKYVSTHIAFGDSTIYVRDYNFCIIVPKEHFPSDSLSSLPRALHTERNVIYSVLKVQIF
jgi:hypothetical protein